MATLDPPADIAAADHRASARRRVLLAGKLVYGDSDLSVGCAIRDLSESGARVRLSGPVALPQRLKLIEVRTGQCFDCEIAWRRVPELGLRFLSCVDLATSERREHWMLKRIWQDNTAR
jgi:hypothetical protein